MADLPNWVLDLVADLLDEEDVHPKYLAEMYVMAAGRHEIVPYPWCPAKPLERVPDDVKTLARNIRSYQQRASQDANLQRVDTPNGERIAYLPPGCTVPDGWTVLGPYPDKP